MIQFCPESFESFVWGMFVSMCLWALATAILAISQGGFHDDER